MVAIAFWFSSPINDGDWADRFSFSMNWPPVARGLPRRAQKDDCSFSLKASQSLEAAVLNQMKKFSKIESLWVSLYNSRQSERSYLEYKMTDVQLIRLERTSDILTISAIFQSMSVSNFKKD
jgi:hypothetical protein